MQIYKGKEGLEATWQEKFKKTIKCKTCKGNCRFMFTAIENVEDNGFICDMYENMKGGKYWVHDACAVAVYLCEKCFEANAEINQA